MCGVDAVGFVGVDCVFGGESGDFFAGAEVEAEVEAGVEGGVGAGVFRIRLWQARVHRDIEGGIGVVGQRTELSEGREESPARASRLRVFPQSQGPAWRGRLR